MTASRTFIVRPLPRPGRTDLKDLFKINLSPTTLILLELRAGDSCWVQASGSIIGPAIAWPAPEKIQDSVVQIPKALQNLFGIKLGDKISILRNDVSIYDARCISLIEVPQPGLEESLPILTETDRAHWAWILGYVLEKAELLCPGVILEGLEVKGERRAFKILKINSSTDRVLSAYQSDTTTQIIDAQTIEHILPNDLSKPLNVASDGIGGLSKQLKQLNDRLTAYSKENQAFRFPSYYRPRRGGIILHGPPGTGKSLVIQKVSMAGWGKVLDLGKTLHATKPNDYSIKIRDVFVEAYRIQPSLIIIDGIEQFAGQKEHPYSESLQSIAPILCQELDQLGDARVLVIATTINLAKTDESLRCAGRFELEIEIPVPDSRARAEILNIVSDHPKDAKIEMMENLADRTHGFVGADLDRLVQLAVDKGKARMLEDNSKIILKSQAANEVEATIEVEVIEPDLNEALLEVRPTAMREVFLETPKVQWKDIGGQHEAKKILEQAIKWPFKFSIDMHRLGIEPKKGLLLYGPPGCSKTLIAKAVATESGLNFIAVKGAELLSMYVGESERAMREVFRKARAASPSILFFDEIDAIGGSRDGSNQHGGLNVLTTLLNELDGIESLRGVFVLAATNKPQTLDPALMRPGRLDKVLYIGLPDYKARRELLEIRLRTMDVDMDVDDVELAEWTNGYSGAELVSVCQKAGYAALEEQVSSGIQQKISNRHFHIALKEVPKQVTPEMVARYRDWESKFS